VVVSGWTPAFSGMAVVTKGSQAPVVLVIFLVTASAVAGCTLEDMIDMTTITRHLDMFSSQ
jgi:hypothetical protein